MPKAVVMVTNYWLVEVPEGTVDIAGLGELKPEEVLLTQTEAALFQEQNSEEYWNNVLADLRAGKVIVLAPESLAQTVDTWRRAKKVPRFKEELE